MDNKKQHLSDFDGYEKTADHYKVRRNNTFGILSNDLETIIPADYAEIIYRDNTGIFFCRKELFKSKDTIYYCFDKNGSFLKELHYSYIWFDYFSNQDYYLFSEADSDFDAFYFDPKNEMTGEFGLIDANLEQQLPARYGWISIHNKDYILYKGDNFEMHTPEDAHKFRSVINYYTLTGGKWGVMDTDHKIKIPFEYDWIYGTRNEQVFVVNKGGAMTYLEQVQDDNGTWFVEGGKWGIVDSENKAIIPVYYNRMSFYEDKILLQEDSDKTATQASVDLEKPYISYVL